MAVLLANGNVIEMKVYFSCKSQIGINVFHFQVSSSAGTGVTDQDVADGFDGSLVPTATPPLSQDAFYEGVGVQKVSPPPTLPVYAHAHRTAGASATPVLPTQVSGIITKRSSFTGRANRGRIYFPFPATQSLDTDETPKAAYVTLIQAYADNIGALHSVTSAGGSANLTPIIVNRTLSHLVVWEDSLARKRWATQRRRGDFGRTNVLPWVD